MAYASHPPGKFIYELLKARWEGSQVRAIPLKTSYAPNQDAHTYAADIVLSEHENVGSGYVQGGAPVNGKTCTYDAALNRTVLAASPVVFAGVQTLRFRYLAIVDKGPTGALPEAQQLIYAVLDYGEEQAMSGAAITLDLDPTGVVLFNAI